MHSLYLLCIVFIICSLTEFGYGAGNTTCAGSMLDWYTDFVGETPCMTYQKLRQICNSEYEVPSFRSSSPGDNCNDQVSACCCNSIAWALSNLCLNCQWDVDSGSVNGQDAPAQAYYLYRFFGDSTNSQYCGDGTNQSLPTDIAMAVCNEGIKLEHFLYNLFWNNGAWFYTYTRESAQTDDAAYGSGVYQSCSSSSSASSQSSVSSAASTLFVPLSGSASLGSSSGTSSGSITKGPSPTTSRSSFVTTLETETTRNGTSILVPYTTTIVSATQSVAALGASGGRNLRIAPIIGGAAGGAVGLLVLVAFGVWCAKSRRKEAAARVLTSDVGDVQSLGPWSPTMVNSSSCLSLDPSRERGDPRSINDPTAIRPRTIGKWELMQQNTNRYCAETSVSSGDGSGLVTAPSVASASRQALLANHLRAESRSSRTFVGPTPPVTMTDDFSFLGREADAGRVVRASSRLPPAYQSEWNAE